MNADLWLTGPLAERWTLVLLHFLWQGAAVATLLLVVLTLVRWSSRGRYLASVAALVLMALCPLATFGLLPRAASPAGPVSGILPAAAVSAAPFSPGRGAATAEHAAQASGRLAELRELLKASALELAHWDKLTGRELLQVAQPWLLVVWLGGAGLLSLRLAAGLLGMLRLAASGEPVEPEWEARLEALGRKLGLRRLPRLCVSSRVSEATVLGFLRPLVLLPAVWLTELPCDAVEAVLAHELAHLRRWDLWVNLGQRIVETLLFFHPAVWWVSRRIRVEREMCCDELAVAVTGRRREYAEALELVARQKCSGPRPAFAAGIGDDQMALLERVRNVLGLVGAQRASRAWLAGLVSLVVLAGAALASLSTDSREAKADEAAKAEAADNAVALADDSDDDDDDDEAAADDVAAELRAAREELEAERQALREELEALRAAHQQELDALRAEIEQLRAGRNAEANDEADDHEDDEARNAEEASSEAENAEREAAEEAAAAEREAHEEIAAAEREAAEELANAEREAAEEAEQAAHEEAEERREAEDEARQAAEEVAAAETEAAEEHAAAEREAAEELAQHEGEAAEEAENAAREAAEEQAEQQREAVEETQAAAAEAEQEAKAAGEEAAQEQREAAEEAEQSAREAQEEAAEQQREAAAAQEDAAREAAEADEEAQREAAEAQEEAKREAAEVEQEAKAEAAEAEEEAKAAANEAKQEAEEEAAEAKEEAEEESKDDEAAIDIKIDVPDADLDELKRDVPVLSEIKHLGRLFRRAGSANPDAEEGRLERLAELVGEAAVVAHDVAGQIDPQWQAELEHAQRVAQDALTDAQKHAQEGLATAKRATAEALADAQKHAGADDSEVQTHVIKALEQVQRELDRATQEADRATRAALDEAKRSRGDAANAKRAADRIEGLKRLDVERMKRDVERQKRKAEGDADRAKREKGDKGKEARVKDKQLKERHEQLVDVKKHLAETIARAQRDSEEATAAAKKEAAQAIAEAEKQVAVAKAEAAKAAEQAKVSAKGEVDEVNAKLKEAAQQVDQARTEAEKATVAAQAQAKQAIDAARHEAQTAIEEARNQARKAADEAREQAKLARDQERQAKADKDRAAKDAKVKEDRAKEDKAKHDDKEAKAKEAKLKEKISQDDQDKAAKVGKGPEPRILRKELKARRDLDRKSARRDRMQQLIKQLHAFEGEENQGALDRLMELVGRQDVDADAQEALKRADKQFEQRIQELQEQNKRLLDQQRAAERDERSKREQQLKNDLDEKVKALEARERELREKLRDAEQRAEKKFQEKIKERDAKEKGDKSGKKPEKAEEARVLLQGGDLLTIMATGVLPDQPIANTFQIQPDGTADLGTAYGVVGLLNQSLEDARTKVQRHLSSRLRKYGLEPNVSVSFAGRTAETARLPSRLGELQIVTPAADDEAEYRLGPSDILLVDAVRLVPKHGTLIQADDVLEIGAVGVLPDRPLEGKFKVHQSGLVDLGEAYWSIKLQGLTVEEASAAVTEHLKEKLADRGLTPEAQVTVHQHAQLPQIAGDHMVTPDGLIELGPVYGAVHVAGKTIPEAKQAIETHLAKFLDRPLVSIDMLAYNSQVYYLQIRRPNGQDVLHRIPFTGNANVSDAVELAVGSLGPSGVLRTVSVLRPGPGGSISEAHVDVQAIAHRAPSATDYRVAAGDRVVVELK